MNEKQQCEACLRWFDPEEMTIGWCDHCYQMHMEIVAELVDDSQ